MFLNSYKKYLSGYKGLKNLSLKTRLQPLQVSEMILLEKRPELIKFVRANGMKPADNIRELAGQVTLAHANRVNKLAKVKNIDPIQAEREIFALSEYRSFTGGGNEADNFAPVLLAPALAVGKGFIEGVNQKRTAQGKKPILSGPFWQSIKDATKGISLTPQGESGLSIGIEGRPMGEPTSGVGMGISRATDELISQGKKQWFRKNIVFIILAVVVVGVGIYFIAKKK
jgi:hypothetical protein